MTVEELIAYYVNLIIIQYHGLPKAVATVTALAKQGVADQIIRQVLDAFDPQTAVGVQLDMLAEFKGAARLQVGLDLTRKYFAMPLTSDIAPLTYKGFALTSDAMLPPSWFFRTVADDFNPTYYLTDYELRQLMLYLAKAQASNHSLAEIDAIYFEFFGTFVTVAETAVMEMTVTHDATNDPFTIFSIVNFAGALMHPAGVKIIVVET